MMLRWLQERARVRRTGRALYDLIVAQSRAAPFYAALGVPDTIEGRFELIVLHMHLVLERLRRDERAGDLLSRALIEAFVADMDANMREIGIADLGVPRRVRKAAAALFERSRVYAAAQHAADDGLSKVLAEHIYEQDDGSSDGPQRLAAYMRRAASHLEAQPSPELLEGVVTFPDVGAAPT